MTKYQTEYQAKYHKDNRESRIKRSKQWYRDNKEKALNWSKQHYQDNKEQIAKRHNQWQQDNPKYSKQYYLNNREHYLKLLKQYRKTPNGKAVVKAIAHNRRALTKGLTIAIIQSVYEDNIKKYGRLTCVLCFKPIEFGKDSIDHLTPLSRQGTNDFNNLGVAHKICNMKKHTMTLKEWFAR